jgi:predicted ester cyclase
MTETTMTNTTTVRPDIKAIARRTLEVYFPAADFEGVRASVSGDFVNTDAPPGTPPGPDGLVGVLRMLHSAFSDQRWEIHQVIGEGDTVVIHCTHHGRHTGEFFGVPATGRTFAYAQMHLLRFVGDRAVAHTAIRDDAALMRQLTAPLQND